MTKSGTTEPLFYETWQDAALEVVRAAGGRKLVAARLWPAKPVNTATQRLTDCLNPQRDEKLSPDELLMLCRIGREANCHVLNAFINGETGYAAPTPLDPEVEKAQLVRELASVMETAKKLVATLEAKGAL